MRLDSTEITVVVASIALMVLVIWYFFGGKR